MNNVFLYRAYFINLVLIMALTQNLLRLWKQKKYSPLYKSIDLHDIIYHLFIIIIIIYYY